MPLPDKPVRHGAPDGPPGSAGTARLLRAWPTIAGFVLIVAGLLLWRDARLNESLFRAVNGLGTEAPTLWSCLSVAGLGLAAWIYLTAFAQARPARVAQLLWILVVGGIVIHFIKHGFASPRPLVALGAGITIIGAPLRTHSMPSGHSAMAFAMLALVLGSAPARARRDRLAATALAAAVAWVALALGIALSRLAVGAHWPSDALFGAGLGLLFAGLAPHAWPVGTLARQLARPCGQRAMAAGLVVCGLSIAATPTLLAALGLAGSKLGHQFATGYPLAEPLQWALALVAFAGAVRWWRAARASA